MVSLAATEVKKIDGRYEPEETLYLEIKPTFDGFDAEAMSIHGLELTDLRENGLEPREAMQRLREWTLDRLSGQTDRAVFVGHNAPFDWSFVNYYFVYTNVPNPFGYSALDTKSLAMGALHLSWNDANKEVIAERLNMPREDKTQKHRADYDAQYQAAILCALLNLNHT